MLRVFLFGAPRIEQAGQGVPLRRSKALALLAYMAVVRQPQDRDTLVGLLWPEFDQESARNNLRRELSLLKSALAEELLHADRQQVAWSHQSGCWVDVAAFADQLAAARALAPDTPAWGQALAEAARLAADEFLAGFSLPDSPAFEEWQFFQRESLRQQLAATLHALMGWHDRQGDYPAAIAHARRWLALDPLHEPAHRELMRLYALAGQHAAALRQYEECARLLEAELGAEPDPATQTLYAEIKARRLSPAPPGPAGDPPATPPAPAPPAPAQTLPSHTTPLVGRERELADILRRLTDPACRLLTLTGPGGIGKTRLALQAAQVLAEGWSGDDDLADGVLYVPLESVQNADGLAPALAAAARCTSFPGVALERQVLDAFRERRMLLVLDNFEHLLDAAGLLADLLAVAPRLRILVTSRVALNLRNEWFHPIDGLSFPQTDAEAASLARLARFDAIRLFEQRARQVRGDFSLSQAQAQVVQLCRLVAGVPLAIELASAWLRVLSIGEVVAALDQGLDILTTRDRDMPARHRSMRAVLDESWRLLGAAEQRLFARLTVFTGGFTAAAAAAVAEASRDGLAALVETALIRPERDGRYQMHALLQQYGAERLAADPAADRTRQAHSAYFISFLAGRRADLSGAGQEAAVAAILADEGNVRRAWAWATARGDLDAIEAAGHPLAVFYEFRGRYREGVAALELAVAALAPLLPPTLPEGAGAPSRPPPREGGAEVSPSTSAERAALIYAARLVDLGWLYLRLGELARAGEAFAASHAHFAAHQVIPLPAQASDPVLGRGMVALMEGDYAEAARMGELALARNTDPQRAVLRPRALFLLTRAAHAAGAYADARRYAEEALEAATDQGHRWLAASLHYELGTTLCALGAYPQASHHYHSSYTLRAAFDDRRGMAAALRGLGMVALGAGRPGDARPMFERSLTILRQVGAAVELGLTLDGLAATALRAGDRGATRRYLREALDQGQASASRPLLLAVILRAAELLLPDESAWGPPALALALADPAADHEMRARARALLDRYAAPAAAYGSLDEAIAPLRVLLADA